MLQVRHRTDEVPRGSVGFDQFGYGVFLSAEGWRFTFNGLLLDGYNGILTLEDYLPITVVRPEDIEGH